ncbi:MAG: hypothetical protein IJ761_06345 [Bacteroidales bacterium]|nr:hypothetical protein [Bacteroidales bacterium]
MPKHKMDALLVNGSVKTAGVTFYTRQGKTVVRAAHSLQPKRRTAKQFDMRMRMKHTIALWHVLKPYNPMFPEGTSAYHRFASAANMLPVVYLPNAKKSGEASVLLPQMPVSEGPLPQIELQIEASTASAALLTNLKPTDIEPTERLMLYEFRQTEVESIPNIEVECRQVPLSDFAKKNGRLVLRDSRFADPMCGWALVRIDGDRCSTQTVVTNCTFYTRFTSDQAREEAIASYGGLTE